jgi:hypothetical protein
MTGSAAEIRTTGVRSALAVSAVLAGALGLALMLAPDRVAAALGASGRDQFAYLAGGSAFFGYAAAIAWIWARAGTGGTWTLLVAITAAAIAVIAGCLVAIARGENSTALLLILAGGVVTTVAGGLAIRAVDDSDGPGARGPAASDADIAPWFVAFLVWGVAASAIFGVGGLVLGATFGQLTGAAAVDDTIYRLAGAGTIGVLAGSLLSVRSRRWSAIEPIVVLGLATNALTLVGALIVLAGRDAPTLLWLIAAAAAFNVAGLGAALLRQGR